MKSIFIGLTKGPEIEAHEKSAMKTFILPIISLEIFSSFLTGF